MKGRIGSYHTALLHSGPAVICFVCTNTIREGEREGTPSTCDPNSSLATLYKINDGQFGVSKVQTLTFDLIPKSLLVLFEWERHFISAPPPPSQSMTRILVLKNSREICFFLGKKWGGGGGKNGCKKLFVFPLRMVQFRFWFPKCIFPNKKGKISFGLKCGCYLSIKILNFKTIVTINEEERNLQTIRLQREEYGSYGCGS